MYRIVVICGGETPSIFSFLNDLVSNRQHESPGEQLVCIVIRPGNHLSEAVTAFFILLLTGSVLLLLWIKPFFFYICSICIKRLYEHKQTSMEDMQNTSCYRPTVAIMALAKLSGRKTNTATSCISLHFEIL